MMPYSKHITAIIYAAAIAFTVILIAHHGEPQSSWVSYLSGASAAVLYVAAIFDKWLWKWSWLHPWFVKRPVIDGTWKIELRSNWEDPATRTRVPPIEGFAVIRQTFSYLSLRLLTAESSSELVGTEIVCSADGLYCVSGVYRNEPRYQVREVSPIHYGAVWLRVNEAPVESLSGHYWTDRKTGGEMESQGRSKIKVMTFDAGRALFPNP